MPEDSRTGRQIHIPPYRLDLDSGLLRAGERTVSLRPKTWAVLFGTPCKTRCGSLFETQILGLEPFEVSVLEAGAVVGLEFGAQAVAAAIGTEVAQVENASSSKRGWATSSTDGTVSVSLACDPGTPKRNSGGRRKPTHEASSDGAPRRRRCPANKGQRYRAEILTADEVRALIRARRHGRPRMPDQSSSSPQAATAPSPWHPRSRPTATASSTRSARARGPCHGVRSLNPPPLPAFREPAATDASRRRGAGAGGSLMLLMYARRSSPRRSGPQIPG
jgi:hypothetical protein